MRLLRHLILLCLITTVATYAAVNCNNAAGDPGVIQAAVNQGGALVMTGTCALGGTVINVNSPIVITGDAQLNSTASSAFVVRANNVSITGLTFNGSGLYLPTVPQQSGFVFKKNTIQNTSGRNGIVVDGILRSSNISGNTFFSIAPNAFASATFASLGFGGCWSAPQKCDVPGSVALQIYGGIDQTTINDNEFDLIANDAIHIGWNIIGGPKSYFLTKNNDISYNKFNRVHRIAIEAQAIWAWPHCGVGGSETCSTANDYSTSTSIKGNYFHDPYLPYVDTYAYSLALWGDGQYLNNAALNNSANGNSIGYGMENMGNNVLAQGNVIGGSPYGWGMGMIYGSQRAGANFQTQNNVMCGPQSVSHNFGLEPNSNGKRTNVYNSVTESCPINFAKSALSLAFVAPELSVDNGTWKVVATSTLPIKYVRFYVDGSPTPAVTQEIQDVNTAFATDRKWLYHAALSLSASDGHMIKAVATDVSDATATQSFTVGNGGPVVVPPVVVPPVVVPPVVVPTQNCDVNVTFSPVAIKCPMNSTCPVSGAYTGQIVCR